MFPALTLQALVNEWDEQERRKREQEQLESSLFRSRSQTHGSGLTEDEQEEKDFRLQFPQFNTVLMQLLSLSTLCITLLPLGLK